MATKQIVFYFLYILLIFALSKCANQMSPPGGEVDKIPPTIIETYPKDGTTNFNESEIEFSFSEYVNKRNINEAFFISPIMENNPEFSWTNKTVYVEFQDSLKNNTTYSVVIGTEITDVNNNNKMTEPFILTFSTGSKIDSGKISGKVYSDNAEGTLIFAYKIDTGLVDIYKEKPSYISQISEKGNYQFNGLSNGLYNLYAVKDEFKDLIYNVGDDKIGIANSFVKLDDQNKNVSNINFFLQKEDTLAPNIQAVTMTDENHIVVEFNEPIDSSKLKTSNFSIVDSTSNVTHEIRYWFKTKSKKNEYVLCFSDSLNEEHEHYLNSKDLFDVRQNQSISETSSFIVSTKPDTNSIKLDMVKTKFDKSTIDFTSPEFEIYFSDAFDSTKIIGSIRLLDTDSISLPIKYKIINNAQILVSSLNDLKPANDYTISVDLTKFIDIANNVGDTVIVKKIKTIGELDFSGASGIVKTDSLKNIYVVAQNIDQSNEKFQTRADKTGKFEFTRLLPSKYLVWAFSDSDSSGSYSYGNINPMQFSEQFKFYPDTLNLRARWPIGDIEIEL